MNNGSAHVSDLAIDRLMADSLPGEEGMRVQSHLDECATCRQRYSEIATQRAAVNVRPLPAFLAAAEPKAAVVPLRASKRRAWLSPALTTLAAAALVLVAMRLPLTGGDVRAKGAVGRLEVYVQRTGETGARPLEGAEVHPGDVLQWVVSLREARWVAIVGSDSAGVASVYFPRADIAATNATWVAAVTDVRLDASLTLDDTLGRETIVALFCVEAPTTIGIDAVAAGCESQRIELTKTARPGR